MHAPTESFWRERAETFEHELPELRRPCGCLRFELTNREAAVLEQIAEGNSTESAAASLFVSHQAVTYHVGNLLAKLQCSNRTGLVSRAFVLGILDPHWPPKVVGRGDRSRRGPTTKCPHRLKDLRYQRTHW